MSGSRDTTHPGDLYAVLGVARDATTEEVKRAFRALARECHPDVAGDSPGASARFKRVRNAYEVLVDPVSRSRYDRRRARPRGSRPNPFGWPPPPPPGAGRSRAAPDPRNDLDLEDIFGQHGGFMDFGFGKDGGSGSRGRPRAARPGPGADICLQVEVPPEVARLGGTVTVSYVRHRRGDDGASLFRYDELVELRVPPGTSHGDCLRVEHMGHAGPGGGPYGDLVCDVVLGPDVAREQGREARVEQPTVLRISVQEALLGGRVELETPRGPVLLTIPPCTSGGTRFRLRGKGPGGGSSDLYVELRISLPSELDDESRELVRRFAELNPYDPREG